MRRTPEAQEFHERLAHAEWMKRWDKGITAPDPRWLKIVMGCVLAGAIITAVVYVVSAVLR